MGNEHGRSAVDDGDGQRGIGPDGERSGGLGAGSPLDATRPIRARIRMPRLSPVTWISWSS
jgi:hypothetical protein